MSVSSDGWMLEWTAHIEVDELEGLSDPFNSICIGLSLCFACMHMAQL